MNTKIERYVNKRLLLITLKFAFTAIVSVYFAILFNLGDLLSCGFIALITLQPNLYRGLKNSFEQIKATTLAALISVIFVYSLNLNLMLSFSLLQIGLSVGITTFFCFKFKWNESIVVAMFTTMYLSVMPYMTHQSFWNTVYLRYITIIIGIGTATIFNFITSLFRYKDRLLINLINISKQINNIILDLEEHILSSDNITENKTKLKSFLDKLQYVFTDLREIQTDINEVEKELINIKRINPNDKLTMTGYLENRISKILNNISHYLWNIILNMLNNKIDILTIKEITPFISNISINFRIIHKNFSALKIKSEPIKEKKFKLNKTEDMYDSNHNISTISIFTDLSQIKINLIEYSKLIKDYISIQS